MVYILFLISILLLYVARFIQVTGRGHKGFDLDRTLWTFCAICQFPFPPFWGSENIAVPTYSMVFCHPFGVFFHAQNRQMPRNRVAVVALALLETSDSRGTSPLLSLMPFQPVFRTAALSSHIAIMPYNRKKHQHTGQFVFEISKFT